MSELGSGIRSTGLWRLGRLVKSAMARRAFDITCRNIILQRPFHLVVIAGQKRSGNHVFINWFLSQSHGPCAFFNHVRPQEYPTDRHRREFRLNRWSAIPTVAFSYEDRELSDIFSGELQNFIARHESQIQSRKLVLVVRDPRNLIASRFRKWPEEHGSPERADQVMAQWISYAEKALEGGIPNATFDMIPVYYNCFVTDQAYRRQLAQKLAIRATSKGLDQVTNYGHGSSFSGTGELDLKNIFERWRVYEEDPAFMRLFADESISDLAKRLELAESVR